MLKEHPPCARRSASSTSATSARGSSSAGRPGGASTSSTTALTNDLRRIGAGQAQYTLCCDEPTGGVVDDLIAYLRSDDEVFLIPNAANTPRSSAGCAADAPAGVEVEDQHRVARRARGAGPAQRRGARGARAADRPRLHVVRRAPRGQGRPVVVCRTGYTGERGYELLPRWDDAGELWDALLEPARASACVPCGLGARDTLRTEMGYPLHGQDLSLEITPGAGACGLGGRLGEARASGAGTRCVREKEQGAPRLLWGLESLDRGIPRAAHARHRATACRSARSPAARSRRPGASGIGLALLDRSVAEGDEVEVDVRGRTSTHAGRQAAVRAQQRAGRAQVPDDRVRRRGHRRRRGLAARRLN